MKYITAEGPSYEWHTGQYRLAGHTYPAPHEPARFVPFDPEITERAMESAAWYGRFASFLSNKARKYEAERDELKTQLETARKAFIEILEADSLLLAHLAVDKALAQIDAGQKCSRCTETNWCGSCDYDKYRAGQKGGK